MRGACQRLGDPLGAAAAALFEGWHIVFASDDGSEGIPALEAASSEFHDLGAAVLEAWSRALLALGLARKRDPGALAAALKAETLANSAGAEGAKLIVYMALARADEGRKDQYDRLAAAARERTGLSVENARQPAPGVEPLPEPALSIHCFGEFRFVVSGQPLDMRTMKPRTRALLRRLSADAGSPVHREVLQDALWPESDGESSSRNLHVAISSLRKALEPGVARGASSLITRDADAYRLVLPPGSQVDLHAFDRALKESHRLCLAGQAAAALEDFQRAVRLAEGELLSDDGSAGWVVHRRERCRTSVLETARQLATLLMAQRQPSTAAAVCAAGLDADRYDDALWRLLIAAREQAGDRVAAGRAEADYLRMVSELGLRTT